MDTSTLLAFSFSFFLIALSPGLCMTLSMTLGISIGVRRTLWMMVGEIAGVVLVGIASLAGVTALMLNYPGIFTAARFAAAGFLLWTAVRAWRSSTDVTVGGIGVGLTERQLITQGFVTATSNPKAWIFLAALLPPFIDPDREIIPQAAILLSLLMVIEFTSLLIYARGGRVLKDMLTRRGLDHWLNRISACMMTGIAAWLVLS
jgi:homoserine/homoserine lactone efflux protein